MKAKKQAHIHKDDPRRTSVDAPTKTKPQKHTPGPWNVEAAHVCHGDWIIAKVERQHGEEQANARLIAASPDLLEALDGLLLAAYGVANSASGVPDNFRVAFGEAAKKAHTAITKAYGGS